MIEAVMGVIGMILYPLFSIVFVLIDVLQAIYFAFAGIDDVAYNGVYIGSGNTGDVNDNGLVFYLLNSDIVKNVFYSIILLAFVLIIIFTVMAFLKNVYAEQPKSWKAILSSTIKGLANFFLVPVFCLLGVWLGNILLVAINGATSATNTMNLSRQLFITSAYNANKIRSGDMYDTITEEAATEIQAFCAQYGVSVDLPSDPNGSTDLEYYASKIDEVYSLDNGPEIHSWLSVGSYYSLTDINYILLVGGGIFILYILVNISFMMVKRIFMLLILFIISPAVCAMYPLDDGQKVKSWKDSFIKQFLNAFSAVAAMNLFFCVSPLIQNITIPGVVDLLGIIPLLLTIAGLYVVKDLISLINSFIGGETGFDTGLAQSVKGRLGQFRKGAQKVAGVAGGAFGAGIGAYKNARDRGSSRKGAFFKGFLGGTAGNLASQLNKASKGWGLGLRGAAGEAYEKSRKDWDPKHKSLEDKANERRQNLIDQAATMEKLRKGRSAMSGHERDKDVKQATRTFGEEIVNNATEVAMGDALQMAQENLARTTVGSSAYNREKQRVDILSGYSDVSGTQVQSEMSSIGSLAKSQKDFKKVLSDIDTMMNSKDADTQYRMRQGFKYSDEQINDSSISAAERDRRLSVNRDVDEYSKKVSERESIGQQLISAFEELKKNTYNDQISSSIDDRLIDGIKEAMETNDISSASQSTQMINALTSIKDSINKGVNASLTTADSMKKVAANTAKKQKKE